MGMGLRGQELHQKRQIVSDRSAGQRSVFRASHGLFEVEIKQLGLAFDNPAQLRLGDHSLQARAATVCFYFASCSHNGSILVLCSITRHWSNLQAYETPLGDGETAGEITRRHTTHRAPYGQTPVGASTGIAKGS
jgi:hypothetical protein